MSTLSSQILFFLLFITVSLPTSGAKALTERAPKAEAISALALRDFVRKDAGKYQATVVNIWATWCEPCKVEMPQFVKFQKSAEARRVRVILMSADKPEDRELADAFLRQAGVSFDTYRLSEAPDVFVKNWEPRWVATLPATFIFDSKGKQTTFWVGETTLKELKSKIKPLLK